jgi:hypothetical protein
MTTFPALVPSSRTFTPGEYPATAFSGFSGAQNRVRHSNVFLAAQLRLTFVGLDEAEMLDIWNHYNGRRGEFRSFDLPTEVASYGSITDYVPGNYLWRYAGPGSVEDLPCGGHNVSITLETVPPIAASVVGADLFLRLRLSAGVADGGEYVPGINETITLSVDTGAAFVALNGIDETITLSLETGEVFGDVEVAGINQIIYLGLVTRAAGSFSSLGIDETITLSLIAGAADDGTTVDPADLGAILWYDFADASTVTTASGRATSVSDKGSRGWTLTSSATGPLYGTGINSLNCIDWGTANHSNYLRNLATTATDLAELYIVLDAPFGSTFPNFCGLVSQAADSLGGFSLTGWSGRDEFVIISHDQAFVNGSASNTYLDILPAINSPSIIRVRAATGTPSTSGGFQIGQDRQFGDRGWQGLIGEVIAFPSVLSESDRGDLMDYLSDKWNIALDP